MRKYLILTLLIFLISCASPADQEVAETEPTAEVTETVAPTATPQPTSTATAEPTATSAPTDTPAPTETALPPPKDIPTETPTPVITSARFNVEGRFTIYGDDPAVGRGGKQFTDPGAVVVHDGQFHMFHNAFTGWPAPVDIVYSVSDDGITWTRVQEEAVWLGNDVPFTGLTSLAASALVLEDGTWVIYFYTWDQRTWPRSTSSIGMATADNPLGPWTIHETPLLEPGPAGAWDSQAVRTPSVHLTDDGYVMFYAGYDEKNSSIGRATSVDGLTWVKHDNLETTDERYAASDPIFTGTGEEIWDKTNVFQPHVVQTDEGWVMLYGSAVNVDRTPVTNRHGLAVSSDGIAWIRTDAPIFLPRDVRTGAGNIWFAELAFADGVFYVYVELGRSGNTEIYVATINAPLNP